jgi:hypothetical protein
MDFISDFNNSSAVDVIAFVKEVVEKFPALRSTIVERLMSTLGEVRAGKVYRGALWIVGEYCVEQKGEQAEFQLIGVMELTLYAVFQISGRCGSGFVLVLVKYPFLLQNSDYWMSSRKTVMSSSMGAQRHQLPVGRGKCSQTAPMRPKVH